MNRSMLTGLVAGIGVATAGGVAGFTLLGKQTPPDQDVALITPEPAQVEAAPAIAPVAAPAPKPVAAAQPAAAPRPAPRPRPAAQPVQAAAPPAEECWDEQVTVTEEPKDQHAIAGTAAGAVVGGAIGHELDEDSDLATAAGAAAGAFIGRKLQRRAQENHEAERTTTETVRRCGPPGSRPVN